MVGASGRRASGRATSGRRPPVRGPAASAVCPRPPVRSGPVTADRGRRGRNGRLLVAAQHGEELRGRRRARAAPAALRVQRHAGMARLHGGEGVRLAGRRRPCPALLGLLPRAAPCPGLSVTPSLPHEAGGGTLPLPVPPQPFPNPARQPRVPAPAWRVPPSGGGHVRRGTSLREMRNSG